MIPGGLGSGKSTELLGGLEELVVVTSDRKLQPRNFHHLAYPIETAADVLRLWREAKAMRGPGRLKLTGDEDVHLCGEPRLWHRAAAPSIGDDADTMPGRRFGGVTSSAHAAWLIGDQLCGSSSISRSEPDYTLVVGRVMDVDGARLQRAG